MLAETLIARPDLGCYVKHLRDWGWVTIRDYLKDSGHDGEFILQRWPRGFPDYLMRWPLSGFLYEVDPFDQGYFEHNDAEFFMWWGRPERLAMFLELCPKLIKIDFEFRQLSDDISSESSTPHLSLTHIVVTHSIKEEGLRFSWLPRLGPMAPRLTSLICFSVSQDAEDLGSVLFPHLTELVLENSSIEVEALQRLLAACPQLQSFTYRYGNTGGATVEPMSPRQAQDAVVRHAPGLISLDLGIKWGDVLVPSNITTDDAETHMRSLKKLTKLESLTLNVGSVINHPRVRRRAALGPEDVLIPSTFEPVQEPGLESLVNMLPDSLYKLTVRRADYEVDPMVDLLAAIGRLGKEAPEKFPRLRRITVEGTHRDEVFELQDSGGVHLFHEYGEPLTYEAQLNGFALAIAGM